MTGIVSNVGVVAIGRNEGARLRACLTSARRDCAAVVYVDSGSTDNSVELAKSLGVHIVVLDLSKPFTAARARNEGYSKLKEIEPGIDAVQFIDGDCEIVDGWIAKASASLTAEEKTAIVCGRRRERNPRASVYNKLCDMEWDTPIGIAMACGGDALIRATAFEQVGGYNGTVIAGEEPEMCVRLRQRGWTIHRIQAEMTLHDAAMTRFNQWWKRSLRSGHAYAQGYFLHGSAPEYFRRRELSSIKKWVLVPILCTVFTVGTVLAVAPQWGLLGMLPLLVYPLLAGKVAMHRLRRQLPEESTGDAVLYGIFIVLGKFPQWLGAQRFQSAHRRGERVALIEYKGPSEQPADQPAALNVGHRRS
jgi:glycosyltransferase involved in cell wall biosynthesis